MKEMLNRKKFNCKVQKANDFYCELLQTNFTQIVDSTRHRETTYSTDTYYHYVNMGVLLPLISQTEARQDLLLSLATHSTTLAQYYLLHSSGFSLTQLNTHRFPLL